MIDGTKSRFLFDFWSLTKFTLFISLYIYLLFFLKLLYKFFFKHNLKSDAILLYSKFLAQEDAVSLPFTQLTSINISFPVSRFLFPSKYL